MRGLAFLGLLGRLDLWSGGHNRGGECGRDLGNALQVERVEELHREDDLVQLHLAINARENSRPSRDGQV